MNAPRVYRDRRDAGHALALCVKDRDVGVDPLVLALPRGGAPVAAEVAAVLNAPLDVFLVRKLGLPEQPELAMGAIASGGVRLLDDGLIAYADVSAETVAEVTARETRELLRREQAYRAGRPPLELKFRPVIVVDDGLATGFSMRAAVAALRKAGCARITVAVPVGARAACEELARDVDILVCPLQPETFRAVGQWYADFAPTTDDEVRACLAQHPARGGMAA